MDNSHTFEDSDVRSLVRIYYLFWIAIIILTFLLTIVRSNMLIQFNVEQDLLVIKSVFVILFLTLIPLVFGYYSFKIKRLRNLVSKEEKLKQYKVFWMVRSVVVLFLLVISNTLYFVTSEKSLMFLLLISVFIYFYCKPSLRTMNNELNEKEQE